MDIEDKGTFTDMKNGARAVYQYAREYRSKFGWFIGLGLVSALGNSAIPYVIGKIFDAIASGSDVSPLPGLILGLGGLLVIFGVIQLSTSLISWWLNVQLQKLSTEIEGGVFLVSAIRKLNHLPLSFHHDHKIGKIIQQIHRARSATYRLLSQLPNLAPPIASIFIAVGFAFIIHPGLATVLVGGIFLFSIFFYKNIKPLGGIQRKVHKAWSSLFGDAWDRLRNPRIVKLAQMEDTESEEIEKGFKAEALPLWMQLYRSWQRLSLYQQLIIVATQVAILLIGAPLVQGGTLTIGDLIAFNGYAALVFGPFVTLGNQWQIVQNGLVDIARTEEMLSTEPEDYNGSGVKPPTLKLPIRFDSVSYRYKDSEEDVLSDISFEIPTGKTIAIVGRSGEGKSTFVDLIPKLIMPTTGSIFLGEHKLQDINLKYLRSRIAFVPQRISLFNESIRYNIMYGNDDVSEHDILTATQKASALEFIESTSEGFESVVGEKGLKLSAGQSQRVAIARAFLANPDILILDEPTSALDAENEKLVVDVLEDLMKDRTTFIIAHRLSTVRNADMILVIENGTIVESGSHHELISQNGAYKKLHDIQIV